eukprot:CAMPEP_0196133652 /NCGR_PEP_ID=MMETSP0910-20130528/2787_1 /TAXON_ID=49265 /ORGANISM="Thalassiosira rotula, Strain GSO102" /LENGTH=622 /DNA_ID=CAMNT_0041393399 /DNA_START=95 /DNA_END=1963 /DNA_ORIENTATION=-
MKLYLPLTYGIFQPLWAASSSSATQQSDVIIIGAGSAGMSAAKTLLSRDATATITILEATHRIGGRVKSVRLGDTNVEMGAEEHYDADGGNPVYAALSTAYPGIYNADGFGDDQDAIVYAMPPSGGEGTCSTVTYGGEGGLTKNCADDAEWERFEQFYSWYWKPSQFKRDPTQTYEDALSKSGKFFKRIPNYKETRGWFLYNNEFGGEYGTTVDKMGAHDTAVMEIKWPLSENVLLNSNNLGYSDLLTNTWWDETISVATVTLKLDSPVTAINVPGSATTDPIEVIADGGPYYASQVIVAVPIGVLKASIDLDPEVQAGDPGYISFSPELPDITKQAIADIGFDQGLKAALKFDRDLPACGTSDPWWVNAVGGDVAYMITNGMSGGWAWPADYKDGSTDDVLMTFIMGDNARELSTLSSDEDVILQILSDLDDMFDGTPASDCFTLDSDNYSIQNWGKAPYTRGAYSFQTPTTVDDDGKFDTGNARARLQRPIYDDRIFFAGEGLSFDMGGSVPGAVFDGERVGNAVTTSGGSECGSIDSSKDCRGNDLCRWQGGKCVDKRNAMGSVVENETSQLSSKESKPNNLRARQNTERKMERGGKNRGIDTRGRDMHNAAKGGKAQM